MTPETTTPETVAPADTDLAALVESCGGTCVTGSAEQAVAFIDRSRYVELVTALRDAGFAMCSDLCGVDYLTHPQRQPTGSFEPQRFEVVANLLDLGNARRIRVRVSVPGDEPVLDSLYGLFPGTEAMEREAWDMFGISFAGHPDLTRILMPDDWEGHPLRKDYGTGAVAVQFKEAGVQPGREVHTGKDRAQRLAAAAAEHAADAPDNALARFVGKIGAKRAGAHRESAPQGDTGGDA